VNDAASHTRDLSRALHRMDVDAAGLVIALQIWWTGNLENTLPPTGETVISNRRRHGRSAPVSHRARSSH